MTVASPADRMALIERNTAEVMGRDDLLGLLGTPTPIRHYIGFEISGKVHLGTGLVSMGKVADFLAADISCHVLLADWHTWINDKLGGDRDVIRRIATGYFTEAMRASLLCVGADPARVHFVLGTDLYETNPDYWTTVIEVSRNTTLARMLRSISILGREQSDSVDFAKLIYPAMQAADIFAQGINLAHAGTEQRKAHVIARDVASRMRTNRLTDSEGRTVKPAAVHHPLLLGLRKPPVWPLPDDADESTLKMSKSDPSSRGVRPRRPRHHPPACRQGLLPARGDAVQPGAQLVRAARLRARRRPGAHRAQRGQRRRDHLRHVRGAGRRLRAAASSTPATPRTRSPPGSSTASSRRARTSPSPRWRPCSTTSRRP